MTKPKTTEKPRTTEKALKPVVSQNGHRPVEKSLKPVASQSVKPSASQNGHTSVDKRSKPASKPPDEPKPAAKPDEPKFLKFQGLLQDFNLSPKGGIEGFLLHNADGVTVQVNVTPECFPVVRGLGQNVEATVEPDDESAKHGKGDHPVYRLISLTGNDGKALVFANRGDAEVVTVQGIVKRINYTRHGEANGVILHSRTFIHLKPEGMKAAGLKVADEVTVTGTASLTPLGEQVIEATTVNGVAVKSTKPAPKRRAH